MANWKQGCSFSSSSTKRFQSCDSFGRQTGTDLEGCETANAAKTVPGQEWQIGNRVVVFQAVQIKTGLFLTEVYQEYA